MAKRTPAKSRPVIKVLSSKKVYSGPVFSVYADQVLEGKYRGRRDVVRHPGSIVVLALDLALKGGPRVLLERQYRHAAKRYMWELPAGRIGPGESKLAAAKRELLEETGYTAKSWKHAFQFYASPGFLDETMDVFLASDLIRGEAQPEEDEQITIRFVQLDRAIRMVMNGVIIDAKTMTSLLWYDNFCK